MKNSYRLIAFLIGFTAVIALAGCGSEPEPVAETPAADPQPVTQADPSTDLFNNCEQNFGQKLNLGGTEICQVIRPVVRRGSYRFNYYSFPTVDQSDVYANYNGLNAQTIEAGDRIVFKGSYGYGSQQWEESGSWWIFSAYTSSNTCGNSKSSGLMVEVGGVRHDLKKNFNQVIDTSGELYWGFDALDTNTTCGFLNVERFDVYHCVDSGNTTVQCPKPQLLPSLPLF